MKKCLIVLLLTIGLVLCGCQKEIPPEPMPIPNTPTQPEEKAVDYGVYTALLQSYEIASCETYDGSRPTLPSEITVDLQEERVYPTGLSYAQLMDLDDNGTEELILFYANVSQKSDIWDLKYGNTCPIQVYTLDEEGLLHHIDSFQPFCKQIADIESQMNVAFTKIEGRTYLVTGAEDTLYTHEVAATVWEYTPLGFEPVITLYGAFDQIAGDWYDATIDDVAVSSGEFKDAYDRWLTPVETVAVWGATQEESTIPANHLADTSTFLAKYPAVTGDFASAVFADNGRFVLFEDTPETPMDTLARDCYADSILSGQECTSIPSFIIRDFCTIPAVNYGYETVCLAEDIANYLAENPIDNHICVRLDVKPVMDFSVSQYEPQTGYAPYLEWQLFAQETSPQGGYVLEQTFNNLFHQDEYGMENPFHISWLGNRQNLADATGAVTHESLDQNSLLWNILWYFDWEAYAAIPILDFGGDQYILVECIYDSMNVHPLAPAKSPIECSYAGPVIIAIHEDMQLPNVTFECTSPAGNLYTYEPILLGGSTLDYGPYATSHNGLPWKYQDAPDSSVPSGENLYGIAFLGYEGTDAITPPYAFLSMEQMDTMESYLHHGDEYFLINPTSETAVIEVYDINPNDPIGGIGALLHQSSPGAPLLLRCNLSDIHQNTAVRIADGDYYASFNPYVDLMSGTACVEEGGYALENSAVEDSLEAICNTVGEDFILGRTFMRQTDEVISGQTCAVYALGTDTPEKFTAEEFLAISNDGTVYWYDVLSTSWRGWSVQG